MSLSQFDRYDEAVLDELEEDVVYGVRHIEDLYRRCTDISRETTARQRKDAILGTDAFEYESIGRFRYTGVPE